MTAGSGEMPEDDLAGSVGYCGIICGICIHARKGCKGCRAGGGEDDCYQRKCSVEKGFDGCWQCDAFPCDNGFFADDAWKGLCIGSIQVIKEHGISRYVDLMAAEHQQLDFGTCRFMNPEDIKRKLLGESKE